jgi:hypothetical protein
MIVKKKVLEKEVVEEAITSSKKESTFKSWQI